MKYILLLAITFTVSSFASEAENRFDKVFNLQGISFHVTSPNLTSINELKITPSDLTIDNSVIKREIDGVVAGAEIADLNSDGSPEIYIYITSVGSGSYGKLVAYSANNKKSLSEIYLPPLSDEKVNTLGYMGHDEFAVVESSFHRRFPIYSEGDSNTKPTGGIRTLQYKLVPGEATWILELINSSELTGSE